MIDFLLDLFVGSFVMWSQNPFKSQNVVELSLLKPSRPTHQVEMYYVTFVVSHKTLFRLMWQITSTRFPSVMADMTSSAVSFNQRRGNANSFRPSRFSSTVSKDRIFLQALCLVNIGRLYVYLNKSLFPSKNTA